MFEQWRQSEEFPTLFRIDREVVVDVGRIFPAAQIRKDQLPLWVKASGLVLEPTMTARQIAWIRRSDGGWLAAVEMPASSANGGSRITMKLWVPAHAIELGNRPTGRRTG
ncbi:hypothetical protein O982_23865 [Mycobacterium avium 10-5581]|nr:hypothetical protein O982_23865 [Mycobacterium avium 10-5581]